MTKLENLLLETNTELLSLASSASSNMAALQLLISDHLPNLTKEQRLQLRNDSEFLLKNSQTLKQNANSLKSIGERI